MKTKQNPVPELLNRESKSVYWYGIVLGIIGFLLYVNTIGHQYVFDDNYAVVKNLYVQEGISGIPKIFTVDFWHFADAKLGYYRPLSIVSFAIEHEFFGNNPHVSHFDNALLFGLTGFLLFLLISQLVPSKHPAFSFLVCLIFVAHPIHTEVVANIKSRDEILSFLNSIVAVLFALGYRKTKARKYLVWSLVFFYLALLSKETALVGIALLPLFLFYAGDKVPQLFKKLLPYAVVAAFFFLQKQYFIGNLEVNFTTDLVNYPYVAKSVKLPSAFHIFAFCLQKMIIPWPLSYDYSYNQIPASTWADPWAWLGFVLFLGLGLITIRELAKKSLWGFGLAFIYITIAPSLGFVFLRGGIFAERFMYAPCLGFAILVTYSLTVLTSKKTMPKTSLVLWFKGNVVLAATTLLICLFFSVLTIARNNVWKDELTLFSSGTDDAPNSCAAHEQYGAAMINEGRFEKDSAKKKHDFDLGIKELQRAISIFPEFGLANFEMAAAYQLVEVNYDSAIKYTQKCIDMAPNYDLNYYDMGIIYQNMKRLRLASYYYNKAIELNPKSAEALKSTAYIKNYTGLDIHEFPAEDTIKRPNIHIQPNHSKEFDQNTKYGTDCIAKNDYIDAIRYFRKAAYLEPEDKQTLIYLANSYGMAKHYQEAINTFLLILKNDPGNQLVIKNIALTYDAVGNKEKAEEMRKRLK